MPRPIPSPPAGCRHLYIIGNGFDRYHGAASTYADFRRYLLRSAPDVAAAFDRYFGPRSPRASFAQADGWQRCELPASVRRERHIPYPRTT